MVPVIRFWSLLLVILSSAYVTADESESTTASLLATLHGKSWATVSPHQGGYRLRLLTDEEKIEAEQTVSQYHESLGRGVDNKELAAAYRSLSADVRAGSFYKIGAFGQSAVELEGDDVHAILPMTSIKVVLFGPTGSLSSESRFARSSAADRSVSRQEFMQALRGGGRGRFAGGSRGGRSSGGAAGGLLGNAAAAGGGRNDADPERNPNLFFLKYAQANSLVDVIQSIYADFDLRIAVEPRLNVIVVYGAPQAVEQIEELIAALDREGMRGPDEERAESPTLKSYSIADADGTTVFQSLQKLLGGQSDVRLALDATTNKIIVLARTKEHADVKAMIEKLGASE